MSQNALSQEKCDYSQPDSTLLGWKLIGIGDIFIVGGTDEALAPIRDSHGPIVIDDADETMVTLKRLGSEITIPMSTHRPAVDFTRGTLTAQSSNMSSGSRSWSKSLSVRRSAKAASPPKL